MSRFRSRNWCLTSFQVDSHPTYLPDKHDVLCYQRELAPGTGRPHWQVFARFRNPVGRAAAQQSIGDEKAHAEAAKAPKAAFDYCQKAESRDPAPDSGPFVFPPGFVWEEDGPAQGKRSDLKDAARILSSGGSIRDVAEQHPGSYIRYHRGFHALQQALSIVPRDGTSAPECLYLFGPPGCGKTRWVYDTFKSIYEKDPVTYWFCGYNGEECMLFDDFTGSIAIDFILRVCDRYPCRVQVKGASTQIARSTRFIVFTSNVPFDDLYPNVAPVHKAALRRRFKHIVDWNGDRSVLEYLRPRDPSPFDAAEGLRLLSMSQEPLPMSQSGWAHLPDESIDLTDL